MGRNLLKSRDDSTNFLYACILGSNQGMNVVTI